MVATETLAATARLRYVLGFLLLVTSVFLLAAMSNSGGWTLGQLITTWSMTPMTTTTCPSTVAAGSTCQVVSTVTEVITSDIDYGLFGSVQYVTGTNTFTTSTLSVDGGAPVRQSTMTSHGIKDASTQENYSLWAKGNSAYIGNVRGSQCFAIWAFLSTTVAWAILIAALHLSSSKKVTESRIKAGFYWLMLSSFSLLLTFVIWVGIPTSAFTNACEPCTSKSTCISDYTCVQLNGGLCPPGQQALGTCVVDAEVTKAGGMWGLVFFSFLIQFFTMVCWRKLYAEVVRSPYEEDAPEARSGDGSEPATDYNSL